MGATIDLWKKQFQTGVKIGLERQKKKKELKEKKKNEQN